MNPVYSTVAWKQGTVFKTDARTAFQEVERLNAQFGGSAPDGALVTASKPITAPLHNEFEWSNAKAGKMYRLDQEKKIKRSLVVISESSVDDHRAPIEIRLYQRTKIQDNGNSRRVYMNTFEMLEDPEGREQLLAQALRDLEIFQNRYRVLTELSGVLEPIQIFLRSATHAA